jgi:hypothetical protein
MKREEIKSVREKESINQALQEVSKQAKEVKVVKEVKGEVKTDLKINAVTDLDKVVEVSRIVEANKTVVEEISNLSNAFKKPSLLLRKSKIRSSKLWRDFRATSQEVKPNPDVISEPKETEMSKWREKNPKSLRLPNLFQPMT